MASAQSPAQNPPATSQFITGTANVKWGNPEPGTGGQPKTLIVLTDDQGQSIALDVDPAALESAGGVDAIDRKRVQVETKIQVTSSRSSVDVLQVESIALDKSGSLRAPSGPLPITGTQRFVSVLCRFSDSTGVTPKSASYISSLVVGATRPQINHFWREQSFNLINIDGSDTAGWFNLPQPRSYYVVNNQLQFLRAAQDCTAQANPTIDFNQYLGINLIFNQDLDGSAWGGSEFLTLDGTTKSWPMTWMPPWGYSNQGILGHEMGHAYGLPHSSGPYGQTYDSKWDVMSHAGYGLGAPDPTYGYVGMGTISYHKDKLNWIPGSRRYDAASGSNQTITIDGLAQVPPTTGTYLMAKIPIGGSSTRFYTVEARKFQGYDVKVPGEGIVIHSVDTARQSNALVVDPDNNNDPNDAGAIWLPGETYTDAANGITIAITSATTDGWQVSVQLGGVAGPANDLFTSASPITTFPSTRTLSTSVATTEPNEATTLTACPSSNVPIGKTVWYRYSATVSTTITVDTIGSSFDTVLAAYTGSTLAGLSRIACDDDSAGASKSRVQFTTVAGTTYYLQAGGWGGASGNLIVNFASTAPPGPANDSFASAETIANLPATRTVTTTAATTETSEPTALTGCPTTNPTTGKTVWYRYTPTANATITVDTAGSGFDTVLAAYTGSTLAGLTRLICNDDITGAQTSRVQFSATAGTTYYVQAGGYGGAGGSLVVNFSATSPTADLSITKTDGRTSIAAGAITTYTIAAQNAGPTVVSGATVMDSFSGQIQSANWTCVAQSGSTCPASGSGNLNAQVNLAVNGTVTFTVNATISPSATGTLTNTATIVAPAGVTDPNSSNNSATDLTTLTAPPPNQVTNIRVKALSMTSLRIEWDYSGPTSDNFRVVQWTGAQWVHLQPLASGSARSWDHTGLVPGTNYVYTVDALNGSGGANGCQVGNCLSANATTYNPTGSAGVSVTRSGSVLLATLTSRPGCGPISSIQFGDSGQLFRNAQVTVISPSGGPSAQGAHFLYAPPAGTTSVSVTIGRVVPSGDATVNPVRIIDGCGESQTFIGGGASAFN
ncbi:MAG: fibronectin type III domain-containing protein [Chloroflexota bacterium]